MARDCKKKMIFVYLGTFKQILTLTKLYKTNIRSFHFYFHPHSLQWSPKICNVDIGFALAYFQILNFYSFFTVLYYYLSTCLVYCIAYFLCTVYLLSTLDKSLKIICPYHQKIKCSVISKNLNVLGKTGLFWNFH